MLVKRYHAALRHHNIDVIDTAHALEGYKVVISPFLACVDENGLKERVLAWVKAGGTWIVGPMSDIMDGNVRKYTDAPYSFLEEAAGVYTVAQEPVANDVFTAKWTDGTPCVVGTCYDAYECRPGTKSLAVYDRGELSGLAAVTERAVGKGKIVLVGSVLSAADLLRLVGLPPVAQASGNVVLVGRSGKEEGIIAVETENAEGYLVLQGRYTDLLTGEAVSGRTALKPYQTRVLKKYGE